MKSSSNLHRLRKLVELADDHLTNHKIGWDDLFWPDCTIQSLQIKAEIMDKLDGTIEYFNILIGPEPETKDDEEKRRIGDI